MSHNTGWRRLNYEWRHFSSCLCHDTFQRVITELFRHWSAGASATNFHSWPFPTYHLLSAQPSNLEFPKFWIADHGAKLWKSSSVAKSFRLELWPLLIGKFGTFVDLIRDGQNSTLFKPEKNNTTFKFQTQFRGEGGRNGIFWSCVTFG